MDNQKAKLIGLDLDGTLLDGKKQISELDQSVILDAMRRGIIVVPVTGRPTSGLPEQVKKLFYKSYAITSNGANIIHMKTEKIVYSAHLSKEKTKELLERMKEIAVRYPVQDGGIERGSLTVELFCNGMGYVERDVLEQLKCNYKNKPIYKYIIETRVPIDGNLIEFLGELPNDIDEISVMTGSKEMKNFLVEQLREDDSINLIQISETDLEITSRQADKGKALQILADLLSIPHSQILACGDGGNDIHMLQAAAIGVAMENATDEVKQIADYITMANTESGVSYAIQRFT